MDRGQGKLEKILLFGTFDIPHLGHQHLFSQAQSLSQNPYLIVSLARDNNVQKIKGRLPRFSETQRLERIISLHAPHLIKEAVLGAPDDYITHIVSISPDIIALGYDQHAYTQNLLQNLRARNCNPKIVRLKPYHAHLFKSSKL